jgi:hypothetical protein
MKMTTADMATPPNTAADSVSTRCTRRAAGLMFQNISGRAYKLEKKRRTIRSAGQRRESATFGPELEPHK